MDSKWLKGVEERMRSLDDASLCRLVALELSEYEPEAVDLAREELVRRGLPELSPQECWNRFREDWLASLGFCYSCWSETNEGAVIPTFAFTVGFVGTRFRPEGEPCAECGSVVVRRWFCLVLPIVPLGRHRSIKLSRQESVVRPFKEQSGRE